MVSVDHAPTDKGSANLSKVTEDGDHQLRQAKFCSTIKIHYMSATEKCKFNNVPRTIQSHCSIQILGMSVQGSHWTSVRERALYLFFIGNRATPRNPNVGSIDLSALFLSKELTPFCVRHRGINNMWGPIYSHKTLDTFMNISLDSDKDLNDNKVIC